MKISGWILDVEEFDLCWCVVRWIGAVGLFMFLCYGVIKSSPMVPIWRCFHSSTVFRCDHSKGQWPHSKSIYFQTLDARGAETWSWEPLRGMGVFSKGIFGV